ncbi:UNVERIFIED_CONTAM: hypothetical protein RF648_19255 [Kocuria sp. CPCC 205274]|uniref:Uncharacterized protein n=1 Tax=Herbiconiux daphne TaxID=2970914 RepID=A0ABT2H9P3_9MICO|nr:hypothetical protein [Herbiconiux daphne]MCS5736671.1 hypothetical protein [Herbiconiux daphne]
MSDARVMKAIEESIKSYEKQIQQQLALQHTAFMMMQQPGNTGHALWSLTSRYKDCDRNIGELRTTIRNLRSRS